MFKKLLHGSSAVEDEKSDSSAKKEPQKPATKPTATPSKKKEAAKKQPSGPPPTVSNKPNLDAKTPEALCGIDPKKMTKDEIKAKLADLYRRHNHAAGSLSAELREEAEKMLDAIVACREKYIVTKKK